MQRVVVCGESALTQGVAARLLMAKTVAEVALYPSAAGEPTALQAVAAHEAKTLTRATAKVLGAADVLVVTDAAVAATEDAAAAAQALLAANLAQLRRVLKAAMAAGFAGQVLVATHEDALLTYFAQRFSGLPKTAVSGIGTVALTTTLQRSLAADLHVPAGVVSAYVVGTAASYVPLWSRAAVAATPVLRLVQAAATTPAPLIDRGENALKAVGAGAEYLWPQVVARLVAALAGRRWVTTISWLATVDAQGLAYARPAVIDARGVTGLAELSGSEAENQAVNAGLAQLQAQIQTIEAGGETDA